MENEDLLGRMLPRFRPRIDESDDGSRYVRFDSGGQTVIMPRDMFEYVYDSSPAPDPTQSDLDEMLRTVDRVRVTAGGLYRGASLGSAVVAETADAAAIADLRRCLQIVETQEPSRCACFGGPVLELFAGEARLASIGLQHGTAIRWARWRHDGPLRDGGALNEWVKAHGVAVSLLELLLSCGFDGTGPDGMAPVGPLPLSRFKQRLWVAEHRRSRGDVAGALAVCDTVLEKKPTLGYGLAVRALCKRDLGDHAGCIADCTAAIEAELVHPDVFFTRAVAYDTLGRRAKAVADCAAALELDPAHYHAFNSRGMIQLRAGNLTGALSDLNEAARLAPTWWLPRMGRAQAFAASGDTRSAIPDFDFVIAALSRSGDDPRLLASMYGKRAKCHWLRGDKNKADADLAAAKKLDPG